MSVVAAAQPVVFAGGVGGIGKVQAASGETREVAFLSLL
jgi:hypothetical protein